MTRVHEDGFAVVLALVTMVVMGALAGALVFTTSTEVAIAANFRSSGEALYAVDAAVERVMADLPGVADWNQILDGTMRASFVDGPAGGVRSLADGTIVNIAQLVNVMNCAKATTCTDADMNLTTTERPWGPNNPRWQPYAYGRLADLQPGQAVNSPFYVVVLVGDDPSENDGDPLHDGAVAGNPGAGILIVHAEALGSRGTRRVVEATVSRQGDPSVPSGARLLSWRTLR